MDDRAFSIRILSQGWLGEQALVRDLCSHGKLELTIGGVPLADGSEDYGISEAALALLRTLEHDHSSSAPVADRLIPHGCGTILMMGCPIGIDWSVAHRSGCVELEDVVIYPQTNESAAQRHPEASVRLPLVQYRTQVLDFAAEVRAFFASAPRKQFCDDLARREYAQFWSEFDEIVARQTTCAQNETHDR